MRLSEKTVAVFIATCTFVQPGCGAFTFKPSNSVNKLNTALSVIPSRVSHTPADHGEASTQSSSTVTRGRGLRTYADTLNDAHMTVTGRAADEKAAATEKVDMDSLLASQAEMWLAEKLSEVDGIKSSDEGRAETKASHSGRKGLSSYVDNLDGVQMCYEGRIQAEKALAERKNKQEIDMKQKLAVHPGIAPMLEVKPIEDYLSSLPSTPEVAAGKGIPSYADSLVGAQLSTSGRNRAEIDTEMRKHDMEAMMSVANMWASVQHEAEIKIAEEARIESSARIAKVPKFAMSAKVGNPLPKVTAKVETPLPKFTAKVGNHLPKLVPKDVKSLQNVELKDIKSLQDFNDKVIIPLQNRTLKAHPKKRLYQMSSVVLWLGLGAGFVYQLPRFFNDLS